MSKLYEKYLMLKKEKPSMLYLFKSGIFYLFLDDDAKKMSMLLNLKLSNLNEKVLKCGFPVNNLSKYSTLIKNAGYEVRIVDFQAETTHSSTDYILNEEIKKFIKKISNIDTNTLSIREAYSLLDSLASQSQKFTKEMKF